MPLLDTAESLPQIVAYLAGKELLLILDNFEHFLDAGGAEFAAGLLDGIAQATTMQGNARAGCQYWQ